MRNSLSTWLEAARPFSLTASFVPVLVGIALAYSSGVAVSAWRAVVVVVGGVLLQVGTNMVNDAYDYWRAVDSEITPRASRVVIEGRLDPTRELRGAYVVFGVSLALAAVLAAAGTPLVLVPVAIGVVAGFGYTAPPLEYKYRGLGIPVVFVTMGPLMVWAAYLGVGGRGWWMPTLVALPVGFLVAAILHANDLRDWEDDRQARIVTLTGCLGFIPAWWLYTFLLLAPYAALSVLVGLHRLLPWTLAAWVTFPVAWRAIRLARRPGRERLAVLDQKTAQLHLAFGLLLALSLGVAR
ncbi:MAG: prenyltransferase [Firmicutes bacterium]|nr:prenyltransferase [Alicyclobacillaceae bacterium]MCL6497185.1 prenyltransferase [Bacillota bacterium]